MMNPTKTCHQLTQKGKKKKGERGTGTKRRVQEPPLISDKSFYVECSQS